MMGIYEICNLCDGKATAYVGGSVDIGERWKQHVRALRRGDHENSHLQRAWNKYSEGAFSFCVLERVKDKASLLMREQYFLDRAFEVGDPYNIARCAEASSRGLTFTQEHRRKISEAARRRPPVSEETRRKIGAASKGRPSARKGKRHSGEARRKNREAHARPYPAFVHRETGEVIPAGRNLKAMCQQRGLDQSNMCAVKNGKKKSCKGWELLKC